MILYECLISPKGLGQSISKIPLARLWTIGIKHRTLTLLPSSSSSSGVAPSWGSSPSRAPWCTAAAASPPAYTTPCPPARVCLALPPTASPPARPHPAEAPPLPAGAPPLTTRSQVSKAGPHLLMWRYCAVLKMVMCVYFPEIRGPTENLGPLICLSVFFFIIFNLTFCFQKL